MTTNSKNGGPAFPIATTNDTIHVCDGMTLRDWFAGQAFASVLSLHVECDARDRTVTYNRVAHLCYEMADAMLRWRAKGGAA